MERRAAQKRPQRESKDTKLENFPHDFDDVYFHNVTLEYLRRLRALRGIVFKKLKSAVDARIHSYDTKNVPLCDSFNIDFPLAEYSTFEWAVIREELMGQGFIVEFYPLAPIVPLIVIPEIAPVIDEQKVSSTSDQGPEILDTESVTEIPEHKYTSLSVTIERKISLTGDNDNVRTDDDESDSEDEDDD